MSQTAVIFACMAVAFIIYATMRGSLGVYLQLIL